MIRHVVLWTLKAQDAEERARDTAAIAGALVPLASVIPGVERLQVGADLGVVEGHWDVALVSDHVSADALAAYQAHPAHVEAAAVVAALVTARACVDFEF